MEQIKNKSQIRRDKFIKRSNRLIASDQVMYERLFSFREKYFPGYVGLYNLLSTKTKEMTGVEAPHHEIAKTMNGSKLFKPVVDAFFELVKIEEEKIKNLNSLEPA